MYSYCTLLLLLRIATLDAWLDLKMICLLRLAHYHEHGGQALTLSCAADFTAE